MNCYFCGGQVTGVEHIPPRSFFPKGKRQNLITVGSCDIHNQEKSKEDEYVRAVLLSSIKLDGENHIEVLRETNARALERIIHRAFENEITKEEAKKVIDIIEKYKHDPACGAKAFDEIASKTLLKIGLIGLLNKDPQDEVVHDGNGNKIKTTSFIYDRERFDNFFDCMARGLFFHEMGYRWVGKVNILPHTFLRDDASQRDKDLSHDYLKHFDRSKSKGDQKEFFCYEGANRINPVTMKPESIFFNFCIYNTFYFTAIFPH